MELITCKSSMFLEQVNLTRLAQKARVGSTTSTCVQNPLTVLTWFSNQLDNFNGGIHRFSQNNFIAGKG